ncbi:MAG: DMT family transporter [Eubacterium sp.]|nr:DMT family transporter [Eubacterium sp.]
MNKSKLTKPYIIWLVSALCCLLWGSAFPAIRRGYEYLHIESADTFSIILFAGVRFFGAGVLTLIIFSLIERKPLLPKKTDAPKIAVLSVFQTIVQYLFFYLGLAFTTGSRASIVNSTSVFFAIFISALIFKQEKLKSNKIIGSVIGFAGVVLVSLDAFKSGGGAVGEAFILISSVSYAFSSAFMKKYSDSSDPAMLSGCQFMLGGAVMIAVGLICGGRLTELNARGVLITVYLMLVSALAYSLWSILIKHNSVSKIAVFGFLTPIFGFVMSLMFDASSKAESSVFAVISLILAVTGIIIVNKNGD